MIYNKLIRDKIPEIIKSKGETATIKVMDEEEYLESIINKIDEEVKELKDAKNEDDKLEEAADLLEVLLAYLKMYNYNLDDLLNIRNGKLLKRGGFEKEPWELKKSILEEIYDNDFYKSLIVVSAQLFVFHKVACAYHKKRYTGIHKPSVCNRAQC